MKTSELMMLDQMFASDVQEEIQIMQDYINNKPPPELKVELDQAKTESNVDDKTSIHHQPDESTEALSAEQPIKSEIKSESFTSNKFGADQEAAAMLPTVLQMLEDSQSSDSKSNLNNNCNSSEDLSGCSTFTIHKEASYTSAVKQESFDIETEITQSVIMKKVPKELAPLELPSTDSPSNAEFSIDYLCSSSNSSPHRKRKQIGDEDENASSSTVSKEPYDEWLCIQKELSMMAEKRIELNAANAAIAATSMDMNRSSVAAPPQRLTTHARDLFYPMHDTPKHDLEHFMSNVAKPTGGHDSPLSELFNTDTLSVAPTSNFDLFTGTSSSSLSIGDKHHTIGVINKCAPRTPEEDWISNQPLQTTSASQDSSKLHWSAGEILSSTSVSPSSPSQFSTNSISTPAKRSTCMEQQSTVFHHDDQSNHRWMMDCAQPTYDFGAVAHTSDLMSGTKRPWSDSMDHMTTTLNTKKMCFNNISATSDRDLLSSPINNHHLQHNTLDQNSLMNHLNNGANHISDGSSFADVLQSLGAGQMCGPNANSNTSLMSNFDDDINRHVQNAIDSILNLHNNEADAMHFPMDPAMASFLAENSPLGAGSHHQQQPHHQQTNNHGLANHSLLMNHHSGGLHVQQQRSGHHGSLATNKRRLHNRMDDISDCLISGGSGADSNGAGGMMMVDSPVSADMTGGGSGPGGMPGTGHGAGEFNIAGGIDEAIKSIITS